MKAFISCLLILSAIQARAESIQWNPQQVRKVLADAERDGQMEKLKIILTPQVIQTLEQYDGGVDTHRGGTESFAHNADREAIAPGLAGAAAAGAAVAVVEYLWDKHVGNGDSQREDWMTPGQFDLTVNPSTVNRAFERALFGIPESTLVAPMGVKPTPVFPPVNPTFPPVNPGLPTLPCVCPSTPSTPPLGYPPVFPPERSMQNPHALTPAAVVVAEATAGALAYKATEYLLNKYGDLTPEDGQIINPNYFDINPANP